jgi:DNA-binding NtrC family response regulator
MPDAGQPREQWAAISTLIRADSGPFPILVVDDELGIRRSVERVLSRVGHPVRGARDVAAAIAALDECHFAAILTDLVMPGRSGLALVDEVEKRRLSTPVILMTASPERLEGSDPRVERLAGIVAKPFDVRRCGA